MKQSDVICKSYVFSFPFKEDYTKVYKHFTKISALQAVYITTELSLKESSHYLQDYVCDQTESSQQRVFNRSIQLSVLKAIKNGQEGC